MEALPASLQHAAVKGNVIVLVKIRHAEERLSYLKSRTEISQLLFSAEVGLSEMEKMEQDPSVECFSLSRPVSPA